MGLFDRFRGMFKDPLKDELTEAFSLKRKDDEPYLEIWEGWTGTIKLSVEFTPDRQNLFLTLGVEGDDDDSIYLERMPIGTSLDEVDQDERLDRLPDLAGTDLAKQYLLAGYPEGDDFSRLNLSAIRDGAPRLSPAAVTVDLYPRAVIIGMSKPDVTRDSFDQDLALAVAMAKALGV